MNNFLSEEDKKFIKNQIDRLINSIEKNIDSDSECICHFFNLDKIYGASWNCPKHGYQSFYLLKDDKFNKVIEYQCGKH